MIDKWIEQLKGGSCISEADLKRLCTHVSSLDYLSISSGANYHVMHMSHFLNFKS